MTRRYLLSPETIKSKVDCDLLILGSGIAGMTAALRASRFSKVAMVTKSFMREGATRYAQGGVAIAIGPTDSPALHLEDTLVAGAGLCDREAVDILVHDAPECFRELLDMGAAFDSVEGEVSLRREGGHSLARVVHAGDATGSEIERTLSRKVRENPNIDLYEHAFLIDLLTGEDGCTGASVWTDEGATIFNSRATLLSTGGIGQLYGVTTNPPISTGDGIGAALRAGARLGDLEFMQFHPTALYTDENPRFLISEALRGEGAHLRDTAGERFMVGRHHLAELAPRDVVVRAMAETMLASGSDHLYLDLRHMDKVHLAKGFPTIYAKLVEEGFDTAVDLIPIAFAAHYFIGGVVTDTWGRTSIQGLYASGEVACTGIHGANRLASNSLLEGLVFSRRIVIDVEDFLSRTPAHASTTVPRDRSERQERVSADADGLTKLQLLRDALAQTMRECAGVFRSAEKLGELQERLPHLKDDIEQLEKAATDPVPFWEGANLVSVAGLIAAACIARTESRGTHLRREFPDRDPEWERKHTVFEQGRAFTVTKLADGIFWKIPERT